MKLLASDGVELAADLFEPTGEVIAAVVMAPALAVPRKLYARFGRSLAEAGLLTITVDYRGTGESRPADHARFEEFELDLRAAAAEVKRRAPGKPLLWIGHSAGGQFMGLLRDVDIRAALLVASGSAYWRIYPWRYRLYLFALFQVMIPVLAPLLGFLPLGGQRVPRGIVEQWAQWGRNPEYIFAHAKKRDGANAFDYAGPLRALAIADDGYAPRPAVESLLGFYSRAQKELVPVRPADWGASRIGHFGFFRPDNERLWADARRWLVQHAR